METKKGEKNGSPGAKNPCTASRRSCQTDAAEKILKKSTVKELVDEIDIQPFHFLSALHRYLPDASEHRGELMEDILEAIKEHPLDPGMKEEGYSFAIQLFRILAANKDICAALMGRTAIWLLWKRLRNWSRTLFCRNFLRCSHRMSTTSNTPTLSASTAAWE